MLMILGVAIVSFIKISDMKKQEAWENVKSQIETAAREYFTANEYLFEGLSEGTTGTISVGKLVSYDYLNRVTNPKTGKSVSTCAVVVIKVLHYIMNVVKLYIKMELNVVNFAMVELIIG